MEIKTTGQFTVAIKKATAELNYLFMSAKWKVSMGELSRKSKWMKAGMFALQLSFWFTFTIFPFINWVKDIEYKLSGWNFTISNLNHLNIPITKYRNLEGSNFPAEIPCLEKSIFDVNETANDQDDNYVRWSSPEFYWRPQRRKTKKKWGKN